MSIEARLADPACDRDERTLTHGVREGDDGVGVGDGHVVHRRRRGRDRSERELAQRRRATFATRERVPGRREAAGKGEGTLSLLGG